MRVPACVIVSNKCRSICHFKTSIIHSSINGIIIIFGDPFRAAQSIRPMSEALRNGKAIAN